MKKVIIIELIFLLIISIANITNAVDPSDPIGSGDFNDRTGLTNKESVTKPLDAALSVIQVIGIATANIMLICLGIKYMVSSVAERAEIKKHAIIYVVGAIIMYGSAGLMEIIKQFSTNLTV